jgi:hypothetical protein
LIFRVSRSVDTSSDGFSMHNTSSDGFSMHNTFAGLECGGSMMSFE